MEIRTEESTEARVHAPIDNWCNACTDGQRDAKNRIRGMLPQHQWEVGDLLNYGGDTYRIIGFEGEGDEERFQMHRLLRQADVSFEDQGLTLRTSRAGGLVMRHDTFDQTPRLKDDTDAWAEAATAWVQEYYPDKAWVWMWVAGIDHPAKAEMAVEALIETARGRAIVTEYNEETGLVRYTVLADGSVWHVDPTDCSPENMDASYYGPRSVTSIEAIEAEQAEARAALVAEHTAKMERLDREMLALDMEHEKITGTLESQLAQLGPREADEEADESPTEGEG